MNKTLQFFLPFFFFLLFFAKLPAQSYSFQSPFVLVLDTGTYDFTKGIEIINTGTATLDFNWESAIKDTLSDSHFEVCNSGNCMGYMPSSGIMPSIAPGTKGWIKLHVYTGKITGTNTIKYVLKRQGNVDTLTFRIVVGIGTGIRQNGIKDNDLTLFPNPVRDFLYLEDKANRIFSVDILDEMGRTVLSAGLMQDGLNGRNDLDLSKLENGLYFVKMRSTDGFSTHKIVVQH